MLLHACASITDDLFAIMHTQFVFCLKYTLYTLYTDIVLTFFTNYNDMIRMQTSLELVYFKHILSKKYEKIGKKTLHKQTYVVYITHSCF